MKYILTPLALLVFFKSSVVAQCLGASSNLLKNSSFETPAQSGDLNGNNFPGINPWANWSMTGGPFNVIRVNGTGYSGGPNNAHQGSQYLDITSGAGTITQNFTLICPTDITFSGWFSSREASGYENWTASIDIVRVSDNQVMGTSNTRLFTASDADDNPSDAIWHQLSGSITNLSTGTYSFRINLGNYGNFDNALMCGNQLCLLPVKLISFSGEKKDNRNQLSWKTAEEINLQKFIIEKSKDGVNYEPIGEVYPQTQTLGIKSYIFTDNTINFEKLAIYRLKMIDIDGSVSLSTPVRLINKEENAAFSVFPNPVVGNTAFFNFTSPYNDPQARLDIISNDGRLVRSVNVILNKGIQTIIINLSNIASGLYVARLNTKGATKFTNLLIE